MLRFLFHSVLGGLAIAFVLMAVFPGLLSDSSEKQPAVYSSVTGPLSGPVSYRDAIANVAPAVVNVYASQLVQRRINPLFQDPLFRRFFGDPGPEQQRNSNLGSGVILNQSGYVLTNAHVIDKADTIQITLTDGRQIAAEVVGIDTETDLAVLRIELQNLPTAPIGDSTILKVGDVVLAIGNPYDFGQTVTQGIVSATGRKRLGISAIEDFIQTDAAINPGNSGGALITATGELIGINTAIFSNSGGSQGIGFAIPINLAMDVMQQIIDNGFVVRGWLGIEAQVVPGDIVEAANLTQGGVLVSGVLMDGPAAKAGIKPGDILIKINNEPLYNPQQAIQMISQFRPGEIININILRGWDELAIHAQVSQRPAFQTQP